MTRLLVSVRNRHEARDAIAGGADVIDVKEPTRGSLGAADSTTISQVLDEVHKRLPTSAALGELVDSDLQVLASLPPQLTMAKFGLSRCADDARWITRWREALERLPPSIEPVAVVYADHEVAESPEPTAVLDAAVSLGCTTLLIDTFDKRRGDLLAHFPMARLRTFVESVHHAGLDVALAGSLRHESVAEVLELEPEFIAVRGAVCEGSRTSAISQDRVREIASQLRDHPSQNAGRSSAVRVRQ